MYSLLNLFNRHLCFKYETEGMVRFSYIKSIFIKHIFVESKKT